MKLFKLTLLVGWGLWFLGAFLIIEFPNAGWNHAVAKMVWVLILGLVVATMGFAASLAIPLVSRLIIQRPPQRESPEKLATTRSQVKLSRALVVVSMALLAAMCFVGALLALIEHQIKASRVYEASVMRARGSTKVVELLGQPVVVGWLVSGQLTESTDGGGHAILTIPLKGPKGNGTLLVEAGRQAGNWRLSALQFVSAGRNSTTNLLAEHVN